MTDMPPLRMIYRCCYESPLTFVAVAGRVVVSTAQDRRVRLFDLDGGVLLKTLDRGSRDVTYVTPVDDVRVVLGMATRWGALDTRSGQITDIGRSYVGFFLFRQSPVAGSSQQP
jgi:hypothetical protein